ncbi:hypothetical protein VTN77DRAFT_1958 [Rasamsonia byssochlamydoides]|uniref:uncharacterized protein n=1 Tax=Rasamsonia byssochlamydoides TaxID=89139 RepID=UPI00374448E8
MLGNRSTLIKAARTTKVLHELGPLITTSEAILLDLSIIYLDSALKECGEKRRAWWAIWEMDGYATTIRQTPTAVLWIASAFLCKRPAMPIIPPIATLLLLCGPDSTENQLDIGFQ